MVAKPVLSVLMPVYNGEEFLKPAIDSVLAQSFRDFELILVNDGSTDSTAMIIESYKDPRIIAVSQQNQGVARSLNNGLERASGKYIRRHDADDISSPDSFGIQVEFLEAHPEYVMVCCQEAFMTASGRIAWNYRIPNNSFFNGREIVDLDFSHFSMDRSSPVVHGTACFRREEVMRIGKYRPEFTVSEDNDLWLRLLETGRIAVMNQCTYFMRLHGSSATQRHAGKIRHFRKLLIEYSRQRRETGSDPIMRGEPVEPPPPSSAVTDEKPGSKGKIFREDLRYIYGLYVNAGDWKLVRKTAAQILHDGWKDTRSWKLLLFPLMGEGLVKRGVTVKSVLRRNPRP